MLSGNPGSNSQVEIKTRRFFRHVLLDQCKVMEDLSMWLNFILKPFPMVHQARMLYLLYGPLCPNTGEFQAWAQFHLAAKHKNLLSMKFLLRLRQDYQPNFYSLHTACYWYSAVVCLSWISHGNLVGSPVFIKEEISRLANLCA